MNVGKYVQALTASNSDMDLNPLIRVNLQTTRTWSDRCGLGINGDYVPQCDLLNPAANGECGAMDNQNFGKEFFTRTFDPDFINGFGKRPNNWEMGVSVQQEVAPRVGVTVGYYRRWFGNFYTLDNTLTTASDYTQFSVPIPVDPRLPGGGGGAVPGVYNLNLNKVGQVQDLALLDQQARRRSDRKLARRRHLASTRGSGTGSRSRRARAPDARFRTTARFGRCCRRPIPGRPSPTTQSGRGNTTAGLTSPYCRIVEPFLTSFRGLATYVVPKVDVQVSATWRSDPGTDLAGELRGDECHREQRAAAARPQPLVGEHHGQPDPAGTLYADRRNNIDFRAAKILRFGRTRTQVGIDVYNVLNSDTVTAYNTAYVAPTATSPSVWLTPTTIATARYVKFNFQIDF